MGENNEARGAAEHEFAQLKRSNPEPICMTLLNIMLGGSSHHPQCQVQQAPLATDPHLRQMAVTLLRPLIVPTSKQSLWMAISEEGKQSIKVVHLVRH